MAGFFPMHKHSCYFSVSNSPQVSMRPADRNSTIRCGATRIMGGGACPKLVGLWKGKRKIGFGTNMTNLSIIYLQITMLDCCFPKRPRRGERMQQDGLQNNAKNITRFFKHPPACRRVWWIVLALVLLVGFALALQ